MTQPALGVSQPDTRTPALPSTEPTASTDFVNANTIIGAVIQENQWMAPDQMARKTRQILQMNASVKSKRQTLIKLADRINESIHPFSACRSTCSHCCSMPTLIYLHEAEQLSASSGRPLKKLKPRLHSVVMAGANQFYGQACPFLSQGRCSVYAVRPIICRLHHSLNATPDNCECTEDRVRKPVMQFDPDLVELPYHQLARRAHPLEPWGVIQEFFPDM
jgi:Fe-S-cluster containining protein